MPKDPLRATTIELLPLENEKRVNFRMFVFGWVMFSLLGFCVGHFFWPREKTVELPVEKTVYVANPELSEKMAKTLALQWLAKCYGVLEVQDGKAKTVKSKRAAVALKRTGLKDETREGWFKDLENKEYKILEYYVENGTGYGLVDDEEGGTFELIWYSGRTKAPQTNPGKIIIAQGIEVKIVG